MVLWLALLAFSRLGEAASKDPTLRTGHAASRSVYSTRSRPAGILKGVHGQSPHSKNRTLKLDSQLKQLENNTSKATNEKKVEAKSSNRATPMPALPSRGDKIDLRLPPQRKSSISSQLGEGSGSRRYGPGRRVTEKSP